MAETASDPLPEKKKRAPTAPKTDAPAWFAEIMTTPSDKLHWPLCILVGRDQRRLATFQAGKEACERLAPEMQFDGTKGMLMLFKNVSLLHTWEGLQAAFEHILQTARREMFKVRNTNAEGEYDARVGVKEFDDLEVEASKSGIELMVFATRDEPVKKLGGTLTFHKDDRVVITLV